MNRPPHQSLATAGSKRPIRVLLVEDNPGDARIILELLREVDETLFQLQTVDRLDAALQRMGRAAVDVVLLDLGLPDSAGLETFRRAHAGAVEEPIIIISGLDDEDTALQAVRAGAQDYLVKGRIDGAALARVIRYAIERQRAELQLRWLTLAVDQSPASVFITDPRGTIQYVNARFTEITGYAPAEAIGKTPRILKSGLNPPEYYQRLWKTILAGETWRAEIQNRRKTGEIYWDAVTVSPIRDSRGEIAHFLAVQEDITRRRTAENTLREREERLSQISDNIKEVFFLQDAQLRETVFINKAYEEMWGRTCQSLYDDPQSFVEAIFPEDRAAMFASLERIQQGEFGGDVEFRVTHTDGSVRWVLAHVAPVRDETGNVYRIAGVCADVTMRRQAQDALRESEQRARTLFETVNLIVLGLDKEGRVNYVNPYYLHVTGFTNEEVIGQDWSTFLPERVRSALQSVFQELITHTEHPHYENPILTKVGGERMIAWSNTVLRDASGHATGTLSIGEDITERNRLELQLRQAQKMEAVGRLAGGVAHDFNNVLTAIFGYVDLLREEIPEGSSAHQDLAEVRKASERAAGLTRQLLAFSRQQILEPVVLDLNDLVEDFEKMLRRVIGEDVELRLALGTDVGNVRADPGQLQQTLMNLVVNARDAMPIGGTLILETANADLTEQYAELHQPVVPGRYIMLAISDTGTGMTAETKARIFEPFFTTKEKGKGTGLGLSTVYGIVKQSGGYVWVYSELGRGTTFKIYLPRVDAPAEQLLPRREPGSIAGSETILLAEDDELLRPLAKGLLQKLGYTVLDAENAATALAAAEAHRGPIHLLVADVVMPGASGRELARQLARLRPETKVLYVSGYTDDAIVHHGMLEPGLNFLQKPFTPATLAKKVREVLDAK
jgi:two-component system, cell cycle sensor histidine kinase and response regulator CckA